MSTLPLKTSINGWNESIRIHSHRFSRRISSILWLLTKCNTQQALAKYFDNFLCNLGNSRAAVENALLGRKGKQYLQEIFRFDRKRSLVVAEPKQLLALVDAILGVAGESFYCDTSDYALWSTYVVHNISRQFQRQGINGYSWCDTYSRRNG